MFLSWLTQTGDIPNEAQSVTYRYLSIETSRIFFWGIAETFVLLYIIQSQSPIQSSILFSVQFALVTLLDYPTGGLGDAIGHRTVLLMAHGLRIVFFGILFFANSFNLFLIAIIIISISFSQESGALEAWYDNNYKYSVGTEDLNRRHYTAIKGRLSTFRQTILAVVFILGGIIADIFSRQLLFAISATGFTLIFFMDLIQLKPSPDQVKSIGTQNLTKNLKEGFMFSVQSPFYIAFFVGFGILWASSSVWYIYLLFQTYDAYSGGSDVYTGLLRSIIFVAGIPLSILATFLSKRIYNTEKWMIIANYVGGIGFFLSVYLLFIFAPPESTLVLWKYVATMLVFITFGGIWFTFMEILGNRFNLDFFPDNIRNSMFSFSSSLSSAIAIPIQIIVGYVLQIHSLKEGILTVWIFVCVGNVLVTISLMHFGKQENSI